MANKRQRLARKRFGVGSDTTIASNTPQRQTTPTKKRPYSELDGQYDGSTAEAQSQKTPKHKHAKPFQTIKTKKLTKHPLRVPGKKPGEGCFICNSEDHIAKHCPQKLAKDRKKVCLFCRKVGHTLSSCPGKQTPEAKFCYNCGQVGHRLADCNEPLKDGGTSYAECFLCKQKGHLSRSCPANGHGIYPKGGSCKVCGGVTHLAKDCPQKGTARLNGAQHVKLQISKEPAPLSKRIVFGSGDDLNDDFTSCKNDMDDEEEIPHTRKGQRGKPLKPQSGSPSLDPFVKKAGKSSLRVVNF